MDEMVFLGVLFGLLVVGLLLVRAFTKRERYQRLGYSPRHESSYRKTSHRPAGHTLVHSHTSTSRMHAADDIWRKHRLKAGESHWQGGTVTANRIFTDSELAKEKRAPEQGHGMTTIEYEPPVQSEDSAKATAKARAEHSSRR